MKKKLKILIIVLALAIASLTIAFTVACHNPCIDRCNMHRGDISNCHCHGRCRTDGCLCHTRCR